MALRTPLTDLFGIDHPVLLAGMNQAAGPELAAAVSNAGGLGVIGGLYLSPKMLQRQITEIKRGLRHPDLPFGVDLLLPATDVSARATNYDCGYHGHVAHNVAHSSHKVAQFARSKSSMAMAW